MAYDSYSRFIAAAKIFLPLAALALLSTVFLFSGRVDPTRSILFEEVNVDKLLQEEGITAPYLSTVMDNGTSIQLSSAQARPHATNQRRLIAIDVHAIVESPDGVVLEFHAPAADIDNAARTALLSGGVKLTQDQELELFAQSILIDTASEEIHATGPIQANGPFGRLEAGLLHIPATQTGQPSEWQFKEGVKLLYVP